MKKEKIFENIDDAAKYAFENNNTTLKIDYDKNNDIHYNKKRELEKTIAEIVIIKGETI